MAARVGIARVGLYGDLDFRIVGCRPRALEMHFGSAHKRLGVFRDLLEEFCHVRQIIALEPWAEYALKFIERKRHFTAATVEICLCSMLLDHHHQVQFVASFLRSGRRIVGQQLDRIEPPFARDRPFAELAPLKRTEVSKQERS